MPYDQDSFATVSGGPYDGARLDFAPHNRGITPVFRIESVIDPAASEKAGRAIYRDMERYTLFVAGDSLSAATGNVDAAIIERFQEAYDKWKRKGHVPINGTPLARWPMATPSFIKEMEFLNIFSVDDLAAVADVNLDRIADGRQWRDKAAAWLKSAKDGAAAAQYAAENARMRDEIAELRAMIEGAGVRDSLPVAKNILRRQKIVARKPMSPENRAAIGERLKAARAAKKAQG